MKKNFKRFLSLFLIVTMIFCSKSFFVFAESVDNELKQASEEVIEESAKEVDEETEETVTVDEESEEVDEEEVVDNTEEEPEEETVQESEETKETEEEGETEESEETKEEGEVESSTVEDETETETEDVVKEEDLMKSASSGKGYRKNIPINYDLAGGEWDENADATDELDHPCVAPASTDEIEELADGKRFDFAIPTPRRDNYKFICWRLGSSHPLRYFTYEPDEVGQALTYRTAVSAVFMPEQVYDEINLVAEWEYRMDTIEYSEEDTDGFRYILINTKLEKDFSKTDYVEYIDRLRDQVMPYSHYLKDVVIMIDGTAVGRLVADFGGRFNRDEYVCNESFVYVFERELRTVAINYDLNGGKWAKVGGEEYSPIQTKAKSETFKLPTLETVEKENFTFLGWKLEGEDDIIDVIAPSDETQVTVVAVYERSHSNINYDLDGGKWVNAIEGNVVTNKTLAESVNLPGKTAVYKRGYRLVGWKLDGEGEVLTVLGATNDDANLVAVWEEVELKKVEFAARGDFWYADAGFDKEDVKSVTFTTVVPSNYASTWQINGNDIVGYVTSDKDVYVYAADDVQITAYPVKDNGFYRYVNFFEGFTSLEKVNNFALVDASETIYFGKVFKDCVNLKEVDFEGFDASGIKEFDKTFMNSGFEELDLTMLDTSRAYLFQDAFRDCKNLRVVSINLISKDYSSGIIDMFKNCPELIAVFVPDDFEGSNFAAPFSPLDDSYNRFAKLNSSVKRTYDEANDEIKEDGFPDFRIATDDNDGVLTAQSYAPAQIGKITYDFGGETVTFVKPENMYDEKLYGRQFYLPIKEEMSFDDELTFLGWYRDEERKDGPIEKLLTDEQGDVTVYAKWAYPTIKWYTLDGGKELHLTFKSIPAEAVESGLDYYAEKQKYDEANLGYDVVEKIVIDDEMAFAEKLTVYDAPFFGDFRKVKEIVGLSKVDFSKLKDFGSMFANCESLESIDLTGIDTSSAESLEMMFANTYALKSVNFGNIDTSKVTNMSSMFAGSGIESIDFKSIDTSNVTDMSFMFYDAKNLTDVNIRRFNTLKVKDFTGMFKDCTSLEKVDLSSFALTYKEGLQNFAYMFSGCSNLVTILATEDFDLYKLKDMSFYFSTNSMFDGCDSLAGEKGTTVAIMSSGSASFEYADIAHIDGYEYGTGFYKSPKPGLFSTKDTAIVIYRSIGSQKADVRVGYGLGDRITPYVDLGANAVYNKYYADANKKVELTGTAMRADVARKVIYVEYYEPAVVKPVANNVTVPTGRSGGSSSSSSGSGSGSSSGVGPLSNTIQATVEEQANQEAEAQAAQAQEVAPNAVTNQESAKSATNASFSTSNDEATWEKNADGTWSLSVSIGNENVTATNTFCTLTETNAVTGQQTNAVYYFDEKGQMATGWVKDNVGNMYFFETANTADVGKMTTGWKSVNGSYYYFGADGKMMSNTMTPDGYYVGANGVWIA